MPDEETGERVVKEDLDPNRRFLVGGVFYDESQDFPIPLAGMNWLWFDWRGTGTQANVFFAGALAQVAVSNPNFLGSRIDVGFDAFGLAIAGTDQVFRGDQELLGEDDQGHQPQHRLQAGPARSATSSSSTSSTSWATRSSPATTTPRPTSWRPRTT